MIIDKIILDGYPIYITKKICYYRHIVELKTRIDDYLLPFCSKELSWIKKYPSVIEQKIELVYFDDISSKEKQIFELESHQPSGGIFCYCGQYLGSGYSTLNSRTYQHQVPRDCFRYLNRELAIKKLKNNLCKNKKVYRAI